MQFSSINRLLIFSSILFLVIFLAWQFYVAAKYNFGFPRVIVDSKNDLIIVSNEVYRFSDIKGIRIIPDEKQPNIWERAFSKSAFNRYISNVELYLNNGTMTTFKINNYGLIKRITNAAANKVNVINETHFDNAYRINTIFTVITVVLAVGLILFASNVIPRY